MTTPEDTKNLTHFLQQHRPVPSSSAPELEERILTAITATPFDRASPSQPQRRLKPVLWIVPSTIAAAGVVMLIQVRSPFVSPNPASDPSPEHLAASVEHSWIETIEEDPLEAELLDPEAGNAGDLR